MGDIIKPADCVLQFNQLRDPVFREQRAVTTGFPFLDDTIKLALGYLMIVTGYPGSGKSEFVDAMLQNTALIHNWRTLYFSPENFPTEEHMAKIAERYIGKSMKYFDDDDTALAMSFLSKYFTWMYPPQPSLETLLNIAEHEHRKHPINVMVLDPWNNVTQDRGTAMLHEYLSEALSRLIRFGRMNKILIIVIAHPKNPAPQKNANDKIPHPNMWDISDGAMWRNKADYGIICHRPCSATHKMEAYFQKIKYKWMGRLGMHTFDYDYGSGRYKSENDSKFLLPGQAQPPF